MTKRPRPVHEPSRFNRTVSFVAPVELIDRLDEIAQRRGASRSEVLRQLVIELVAGDGKGIQAGGFSEFASTALFLKVPQQVDARTTVFEISFIIPDTAFSADARLIGNPNRLVRPIRQDIAAAIDSRLPGLKPLLEGGQVRLGSLHFENGKLTISTGALAVLGTIYTGVADYSDVRENIPLLLNDVKSAVEWVLKDYKAEKVDFKYPDPNAILRELAPFTRPDDEQQPEKPRSK